MSIKNKDLFLQKLIQELKSSEAVLPFEPVGALTTDEKLDVDDRLFIAILLNHLDIVESLLKVGADPNATNKQGTTLLQLALAFEREEVAHLLLKYGAMPTFQTNKKFKI